MWRNNIANVNSLASLSTNHCTERQYKWSWMRGHLVLFPVSSFYSEDSTSSFVHGFDRCHYGRKWLGRDVGGSRPLYAKNSVVHMLNGRVYARGIRAHLISQSALGDTTTGVVHCSREFEERRIHMFRVFA